MAARALWAKVMPHLPQPADDLETLATIHHARTQAKSLPLRLRAYSHRWLCERLLPSGLPDWLRPKAERMYPRLVEAVGIAVKPITGETPPIVAAFSLHVRGAMEYAVEDAFANGDKDPTIVKGRMMEARAYARKHFG